MNDVIIYSTGICYCSVCTTLTDVTELTKKVNELNPAGRHYRWKKSEESFRSGEPNPCPCEQCKGRKHYLFVC